MITYRKIEGKSTGKLVVAYLRENQSEPNLDKNHIRDYNSENGERLNNYYTGREGRGEWGPGLGPHIKAALGIDTSVLPSDEALARLFECKRADNGEAWKGSRKYSGFDFTASPDKSVSLAAEFAPTLAEQALIWTAIHKANDKTMAFIANEIGYARRGKGGKGLAEKGEVAWTSFRHYTSRPTLMIQDGSDGATAAVELPVPGDPQAHIHNALFNVVATESGHIGSLDTARITNTTSHLFGAVFQAELAKNLREIGVKVSVDQRNKAVVIDSIPKNICDLFSKRAKQTEKMAQDYIKRHGGDWSAMSAEEKYRLMHQANLVYRAKKYDGKNDKEFWLEQAREAGWVHESVLTNEIVATRSSEERYEIAYQIASKLLSDEFKTSAVLDKDILRVHATHGLITAGYDNARDIDNVVNLIQERGIEVNGVRTKLIEHEQEKKNKVATDQQVSIEYNMAKKAYKAARDTHGALSRTQIDIAIARSDLDFEKEVNHGRAQMKAIYSLGTAGGLAFLTGVAGSGKTTLLKPLVDAWHSDERNIIGTAVAWRQADALKDAGIEKTLALAPLLNQLDSGSLRLDSSSVLIIDEVSLLSPSQLLTILQYQEQQKFIIRLLGDREQAQSIEAGDIIELLNRVLTQDQAPQLLSTIRQRTNRERYIAEQFRSLGPDPSLTHEELRKRDFLQVCKAVEMKRLDGTIKLLGGNSAEVNEQIAELYLTRRDKLKEAGSTKGITISAPTNSDVMEISQVIRQHLRKRGEIGVKEIVFPAVDQRGEQYELPVSVGDKFRLFSRVSVQVKTSHGKRWRQLGSNGDFVTVKGLEREGFILENSKGIRGLAPWKNIMDSETKRIKLGFGHAMTIDAAQGITSDEHINAMPKGTAGLSGFKAYVGESRHIHKCWTVIAEGPIRESITWSRAIGDITPITLDDIYNQIAKDLSRHPYKSLAVDLAKTEFDFKKEEKNYERQNCEWIMNSQKIEALGSDPGRKIREKIEENLYLKPGQWDDINRRLNKLGRKLLNEISHEKVAIPKNVHNPEKDNHSQINRSPSY